MTEPSPSDLPQNHRSEGARAAGAERTPSLSGAFLLVKVRIVTGTLGFPRVIVTQRKNGQGLYLPCEV